jgi:hypothetical protein
LAAPAVVSRDGCGAECRPYGRARDEEGPPEVPLESGTRNAYYPAMSETSPEAPVPARWHDSLARSKAQVAAGQSVPLLPVLDRLRSSAERLEAEQEVTADGVKVTAVED